MNDLVANVLLSDSADRAQCMKTRLGTVPHPRIRRRQHGVYSLVEIVSSPATVRHCTFMKEETSICSSSRGLIAEDEETTSALLPRDSK